MPYVKFLPSNDSLLNPKSRGTTPRPSPAGSTSVRHAFANALLRDDAAVDRDRERDARTAVGATGPSSAATVAVVDLLALLGARPAFCLWSVPSPEDRLAPTPPLFDAAVSFFIAAFFFVSFSFVVVSFFFFSAATVCFFVAFCSSATTLLACALRDDVLRDDDAAAGLPSSGASSVRESDDSFALAVAVLPLFRTLSTMLVVPEGFFGFFDFLSLLPSSLPSRLEMLPSAVRPTAVDAAAATEGAASLLTSSLSSLSTLAFPRCRSRNEYRPLIIYIFESGWGGAAGGPKRIFGGFNHPSW
eukprot:CAMPEP_0181113644 /NCGR_PEP_ID=MMETSP1071-20121207/20457_1 /TAXON_ID=35127 /ORGANISM="Thalassiosira sp., Strain NH16" /LENGTH=301 /DNA_ID=CAMNT_0023197695 /DNA_START=52 /DNA_END=954 /DNA_ORIENTATION=-